MALFIRKLNKHLDLLDCCLSIIKEDDLRHSSFYIIGEDLSALVNQNSFKKLTIRPKILNPRSFLELILSMHSNKESISDKRDFKLLYKALYAKSDKNVDGDAYVIGELLEKHSADTLYSYLNIDMSDKIKVFLNDMNKNGQSALFTESLAYKVPQNSLLIYVANPNIDNDFYKFLINNSDIDDIYILYPNPQSHEAYSVFKEVDTLLEKYVVQEFESKVDNNEGNELKLLQSRLYGVDDDLEASSLVKIIEAGGDESLIYSIFKEITHILNIGKNVAVISTSDLYAQKLSDLLYINSIQHNNYFGQLLLKDSYIQLLLSLLAYCKNASSEDMLSFLKILNKHEYKTFEQLIINTYNINSSAVEEFMQIENPNLYTLVQHFKEVFTSFDFIEFEYVQQCLDELYEFTFDKPLNYVQYQPVISLINKYYKLSNKYNIKLNIEELISNLSSLRKIYIQDTCQVDIMPTNKLSYKLYDYVIMLDLNSDQYPAYRGQRPIDLFRQRNQLPISQEFFKLRRYEFYRIISAAQEGLILAKTTIDKSGDKLQSSLYFNEVFDLYLRYNADDNHDIPQQFYDKNLVISYYDNQLELVAPASSKLIQHERDAATKGEFIE